eukprot:4274895-Pyramimonas_sp.AAC.1
MAQDQPGLDARKSDPSPEWPLVRAHGAPSTLACGLRFGPCAAPLEPRTKVHSCPRSPLRAGGGRGGPWEAGSGAGAQLGCTSVTPREILALDAWLSGGGQP